MKSSQIVDFSRCLLRLAVVAAVLAATFFVTASPVLSDSDTLEVDTTLDSNDPAYQQCTAAANDCSLRGAISKANDDDSKTYTIVLDNNTTYFLALDETKEPNETGDLNISKSLTIEGNDAKIDAQGCDRVFNINGGDIIDGDNFIPGSFTLRNLTITGGHAPDGRDGTVDQAPGDASSGGGIYYTGKGTLTLENCTVIRNWAGKGGNGQPGADAAGGQPATPGGDGKTGGSGGGIDTSTNSTLVLISTQIVENQAGNGGDGGAGGNGDAGNPGASGGKGWTGGRGGGVDAGGDLQMVDSLVQGNGAGNGGAGGPGGRGGDNAAGSATDGGKGGDGGAGAHGGGVYGTTTSIHRTLVADNVSGVGGAGGTGGDGGDSQVADGGNGGEGGKGGWGSSGGGIYLSKGGDLVNSTIAHNQAGSQGAVGAGGLAGSGVQPGTSGNDGILSTVKAQGGGIYTIGSTEEDPVRLLFVTIVENSADEGAGIRNSGVLIIRNSILVRNVKSGGTFNDCQHNNLTFSVTSLGSNLYTNFHNCTKEPNTDIDLTPAAEAGLLELADNGGPTKTVALADDSPALDAGLCEGFDAIGERSALDAPDTDQRGSPRPIGETCDIGAYEYESPSGSFVYLPLVLR